MTDYSNPHLALAAHLEVDASEVEPTKYDETEFTCQGAEYRVLSESERETAADAALESYIDECLLAEVPKGSLGDTLRQYFDRDAWKRDALLSDGYGHTLNGYDGSEEEQKIDGVWFYIYRVN